MKLSTESAVRLGFGLALGCLLWTSVAAYRSAIKSADRLRGEHASARLLELVCNLRNAALDMETGTRGFIVSGQGAFLEPYNAGLTNISANLDVLRGAGANPAQARIVHALDAEIATLSAACARQIAARKAGPLDAASELTAVKEEKAAMDAIRQSLDALEQDERNQVAVRSAQAQQAVLLSGRTILWSGIIALTAVTAASAVAHRDLARRSRAEAALREAEANTRLMLAGIQDYAIYMLDPQGRIATWNAPAEKIHGFPAAEIVGLHFSKLFPPEDAAQDRPNRELADAIAHGRCEDENQRMRKDGSRFWASVVVSPVRDDRGELRGFVKVTRDITERRRAERKFMGLFESAPDAMLLVNRHGAIVLANAQATRVFGWTTPELTGRQLDSLLPERFRAEHRRHLDHFFTRPVARGMGSGMNLWGIRKDGTEFPAEIGLAPLETDDGPMACASIRDITERKRAEQEIAQLNEDLRRRAGELEATNRELDAFSYSVSHDLRAPLRHIQGFVDRLNKSAGPKLDEQAARYLRIISDSARQMGALIDDLLSFSRNGRVELASSAVDLESMARGVIQELQADSPPRNILWKVGHLPAVRGDPILLRQVVVNLLANALKYTRGRDPAVIEIDSVNHNPAEHVVAVRDNGVGFEMEYAHKLFGVFQRLHRAEDFEGTGIGLANVRRIVLRHGGRVWAEGKPDAGATFYFSLPKTIATVQS